MTVYTPETAAGESDDTHTSNHPRHHRRGGDTCKDLGFRGQLITEDAMATVKISELPAGTASTGAVVPATNAAGTTTEKITLGAIAGLPHAHGNITSDGKVGTASGLPLITAAAGVVTAGAFGSSAGQFCQGNDARLADARVPTGHKASHATGASDALSPSDIGAASASHVHAVADITGFTAAASAAAPVQSVNGLTGAITLPDDTRWGAFMPPAPAAPTATAGNAQVALTWTAPTVLAQTPITDYVVQYSSNGGSTWTTFSDGMSTATSATVTGLTNGTAYTFRVAAVNAVGQGAYSTASASVTPLSSFSVTALVIAGGGGGGVATGGGGGAGGYLTQSLTLVPSQQYTVTVGAGGVGSSPGGGGAGNAGGNGSASVFSSLSAVGGGGGGASGAGGAYDGSNGGSGGGGGGETQPGHGTGGQGNDGGNGRTSFPFAGGGGGGAAQVGSSASGSGGGAGGDGLFSSITGSAVAYAGGGGAGSVFGGHGAGGAGGGGGGARGQGAAGSVNSGGGGGSSGDSSFGSNPGGAAGGSGVVIIRAPQAAASTTGSPTVTTVGGDTVYTFTGSGSITF